MTPRPEELPEGTDHIINGAMETEPRPEKQTSASGGFVASGGASADPAISDDSEDKMSKAPTKAAGTGGKTDGGGTGGGVRDQVRGQIYNLRDQATGRVRSYAEDGKTRASDLLADLARVVEDTAESIDGRLGKDYGEYARKAADGVTNLADTLRRQEVDEIYDSVRDAVRKSPGVAIGIAAVVGFTLVRLIKAGLPDEDEDEGGGNGRRRGSGA